MYMLVKKFHGNFHDMEHKNVTLNTIHNGFVSDKGQALSIYQCQSAISKEHVVYGVANTYSRK